MWVSPGVSSLEPWTWLTVIAADGADAEPWWRRRDRRVPMAALGSEGLATQFGANAIIVRPDQLVAWCGDAAPPDTNVLLDDVSGWIAADTCGTPTTAARNK